MYAKHYLCVTFAYSKSSKTQVGTVNVVKICVFWDVKS
jgi:hypothetical protein